MSITIVMSNENGRVCNHLAEVSNERPQASNHSAKVSNERTEASNNPTLLQQHLNLLNQFHIFTIQIRQLGIDHFIEIHIALQLQLFKQLLRLQ